MRIHNIQILFFYLVFSFSCPSFGADYEKSISLEKTNVTATSLADIKKPTKWFEWGFDFRFRHEFYNNASTLSSHKPAHESDYQRYRARVNFSFIASEDLSLNTRLTWEGREYFKPDSKSGMNWDEIIFDNFNLKLGNQKNRPLTLILGRQDFSFGDKWLIFDGSTVDGSRSEFFDAARLIWNLPEYKTTVNMIYFDNASDSERWLHPINSRNSPVTEEDTRGAILYLENKSIKNTQLDGYFIYKHDRKVLANGNSGDRYIEGARAVFKPTKHWKNTVEFAVQSGTKNGDDLLAYGGHGQIQYLFNDSFQNKIHLGYEYLSGDDPNTKTVEAWDPLWSRRAIWSELLVPTFAAESNGRTAEWSNLQRLETGWSISPVKNIEFLETYSPIFANENTLAGKSGYSNDGMFRGHLLSSVLKFNITKNLTGHLWAEFFFPGDYYSPDRREMATFFRTQLYYQF